MPPKEKIIQALGNLGLVFHKSLGTYCVDVDKIADYILEREKAQVAKVINPIRKYDGALGCYATDALTSIHKSLAIADEIIKNKGEHT